MKQYKDIDELNAAVESGEINNRRDAIKAKCLDCSAYQPNEVRECSVTKCPLYAFRLGKDPYRKVVKRELTDEEREAIRNRLAGARAKSNS